MLASDIKNQTTLQMYIDYLGCAREILKSFRQFLTKKQSLKVQGCYITTGLMWLALCHRFFTLMLVEICAMECLN